MIGRLLVLAAFLGAVLIAIFEPSHALRWLAADTALGFAGTLIP